MAASSSVEGFFNGRTVMVTGAGQGIGRALSKKLVSCGAKVLAVSRTASHLETLKDETKSGPGSVEAHSIDVGADWNKTKEVIGKLGPQVDCLVNSAAVASLEPFLEMKEKSFDVLMSVNVKAMINVSQEVCKAMVARGHLGSVVNISSLASTLAVNDHIAYCATKGAVDMVTKVMALEMGKHKIRVNAINPTVVMTPMGKYAWSDPAKANPMLARIPLGKFVEEADVVNTIMFLLSDQCHMINGTCLVVDGGLSCS